MRHLDFLGHDVFAVLAHKFGDQFFDDGLSSMKDLEDGAEGEPGVAVRHFELGRRYLQDAKYAMAGSSLRRALELEPGSAQSRVGLACSLKSMGHTSEAIDELHRCLDDHPNYVPAENALEFCVHAGERRHDLSDRELELEFAAAT